MPELPKCDDLIAPTLDLQPYEDKAIRDLAKGMKSGEPPEYVIQRLLQDPSLKTESEKFLQHADAVCSRIAEPRIREKYNSKILELRKEKEKKIRTLEEQLEEVNKRVMSYSDQVNSYRSELEGLVGRYRVKLSNLLTKVDPREVQEQKKSQRGKSLFRRIYNYIIEKFYKWRGYEPQLVEEELKFLTQDLKTLGLEQRQSE